MELQQSDDLAATERAVLAELERRRAENRLAYYEPYAPQKRFHEAGATYRERLLLSGNQVGKTYAGGMEAAYHATGRYPDWWTGRRFEKATIGWACGETNEVVRDVVQRTLVGRPGMPGTGSIPKDAIIDVQSARGIADLADSIRVRHVSGGISSIGLKSYQRGRESFQGETLDWVHLDEEPPADIYSEALTRTNATDGILWMTFTPLLGMSSVVKRYLSEKAPDRCVITATIHDAGHFTAEKREAIIASYPSHERDARAFGIPTLGSGRIFPVSEESIACDQRDIPKHWVRIGGLDFGWDHPAAAVELAHDRDSDTVYVIRAFRAREMSPVTFSAALRPWGKKLPWAWPRDGRRETMEGAGLALADQYRAQGLNMMSTHAQYDDKSVSVEAGLMDMLSRMQTGKFKVFRHLVDWFEEFRLYHRKDGRVVKEGDDLMSATRYAVMMLRYAEPSVRPEYVRGSPRFSPARSATGWMGA